MRIARTKTLAAVLTLTLGLAGQALATLSGSSSTSSGSGCGASDADGSCRFSVQQQTNTPTTFKSRYAWNINTDIGVFSTRNISGSSQHNVAFNAAAPGGYRIVIATQRTGDLNRINDLAGCDGSADTSGVTGSSNIALNSGSLSLGDPGTIGNGGDNTNLPFNQTASATIFRVSNGAAQSHALTFTWNGSTRSNSCESAVRQGESSGTTTGCSACAYPGSPSRTDSTDGHFATVTFTSLCGNNTIDGSVSEQCDLGSANGAFGSCCTSQCQFTTAGTSCRTAAGECDLQENCTGSSATCPADAKKTNGTACTSDGNPCSLDQCDGSSDLCQHPAGNGGTPCRASAGTCDVAENCTGSSTVCPTNVFVPSTTVCRAAAGACDLAENCPGNAANCPTDAKKPNGTTCRASAGACDPAETCNGSSTTCPADALSASSVVCRAAGGPCDVVENCTGSGPTCPPDTVASSSVICRAQNGDCDIPENCPGDSVFCPGDSVAGAFVECRPAAGGCDVAENCDGVSHFCPGDTLRPSTFTCRASAGTCDVAENCTGSGAACPADSFASSSTECRASAGPCDVAENCTGTGAACPANGFASSSTVCRASAGACDVAENCTGAGAACPANAFASSSVVCRAASGACDLAENCTGSSATCPADGLQPSGVVCRAPAGGCDAAESCSGSSTSCPADALAASGTVCRASASTCDVAESCSGSGAQCPADAVQPSSVTCRAAAGACDVAENCTGLIGVCPPDLALLDGAVCSDGSGCTQGDTCQSGVCVGTPTLDTCLDDFLCYKARGHGFTSIPSVHLVDSFEDQSFTVLRAKNLCTPADKNDGNGTVDPAIHLVSYQIRTNGGTHTRRTNLQVTNQLGTIFVDTIRPDLLFVPSAKSLTTPPSAPPNNSHAVDHYKCYKVRVSRGTPRFVRQPITFTDQFSTTKVFELKKPRHLCTPVDKNSEGIKNADAHLLCYLGKPFSGPKFQKQTGILTADQFGNLTVDAIKEREFCIPSLQLP